MAKLEVLRNIVNEKKTNQMQNSFELINKYKKSFIWLVIIIIMFWYVGIRPEIRVSDLKENGKQIKAYLYDVKDVGSKGTIRGLYRFKINNNLYEGFYDNDKLVKYDSIDIMYLPDNPERNQAKQFLEDY
ncbi:hypothetical protein [Flavobacterium sp. T12S277]|uniref:hypothetical protein n=1 Tax=Flavobacterium sp. T12S277 TaxID=3402752 RepID=UPI003AEAFDA7